MRVLPLVARIGEMLDIAILMGRSEQKGDNLQRACGCAIIYQSLLLGRS